MREEQERVRRFHEAMVQVGAKASVRAIGDPSMDIDEAMLRARLVVEEAVEAAAALVGSNRARRIGIEVLAVMPDRNEAAWKNVAQELADVCVVTLGTAVAAGIDLSPVFDEVMTANERKVGPDARVREDGKLLKPEGWVGPDVAAVLARQKVGKP